MIRGRRFFQGLVVLAAGAALSTALAGPGQRVDDARYGEVLFQFYQEDYFTAISHLLAARSQGRLTHDWFEAELLLGGLKLSYGLTDSAEKIFQRLLAQQTTPSVRDHAWYYLAQLAFQKGRLDQAAHALARISEELPPELAGKRQLLSALVQMQQGDYAGAVKALSPWRGVPEAEVYGRYNLGIALIRSGETRRGVGQLQHITRVRADTEAARALRDKANVAIGQALLQEEQPAQARRALDRVRLQGPSSSMALLGAGWAEMVAGDHQAALVPWTELRSRPIADPAVQEAMLAAPYALLKLQARDQAADMYRVGTELLEAEAGRIDAAMKDIRSGGLLDAALSIDPRSNELPPMEGIPGRHYLGTLIASHGFRRALQDHQDIEALAANLRWWRDQLDQLDAALAAHRHRFEQKLPGLREQLARLGPEALQERYQALKIALPASRDEDFQALEQELARLQQHRSALAAVEARAEDDFRAFSGRIQLMRERIEALLPRIEETRIQRRQVLEMRALQALGARRDAVRSQVTQARFILAQLYDPAADKPKEAQ
jgi:outer membrane protein assembly factor BamD (BamD/ComL family)